MPAQWQYSDKTVFQLSRMTFWKISTVLLNFPSPRASCLVLFLTLKLAVNHNFWGHGKLVFLFMEMILLNQNKCLFQSYFILLFWLACLILFVTFHLTMFAFIPYWTITNIYYYNSKRNNALYYNYKYFTIFCFFPEVLWN